MSKPSAKQAEPSSSAVGQTAVARPRRAKRLLFGALAIVLSLVVLEGVSSIGLFFYDALFHSQPLLAERVSTEYDAELGWVSRANVDLPDLYGPRASLRTNARGFRNDQDFDIEVPAGKLRVLCSGDSFTLGYGVANEHTWGTALASLDGRLETVNMGQGGYGLDQAYLWYLRDGQTLRHDVHLFAFVSEDFGRMRFNHFLRYPKPVLRLENDKLVTTNVPVPRRAYALPWFTQNIDLMRRISTFRTVERMAGTLSLGASPEPILSVDETLGVTLRIFEELDAINRRTGGIFIAVYLPYLPDYSGVHSVREFLRIETEKRNIRFLDLATDFRRMPAQDVSGLFIGDGDGQFFGAAGHYSLAGNQYIAEALYQKLVELPEVAAKLAALE